MAVVPLTFVLAYYADLAYGSKLYRIKGLFFNSFRIIFSLSLTRNEFYLVYLHDLFSIFYF